MSYQVVIIGAGISGLYAACNLIDLGIKDILILEAQNRIGGRMHSIQMKIPKENDKNEKEDLLYTQILFLNYPDSGCCSSLFFRSLHFVNSKH